MATRISAVAVGAERSTGLKRPAEKEEKGFAELLSQGFAEVNRLQHEALLASRKAALGELEDVHQAVLAVQKANLALEFTIQLRNKLVEAYQEIMRMQM